MIDDYEDTSAERKRDGEYLTKETFYMCVMKLVAHFDEDDLEIERIKDEIQEFLTEQGMYPSKSSKRKRKLGHYNFNELRNHQIYRNDVKLVLSICPPSLKGDLRGWDLEFLQKKINFREFFTSRNLQIACIRGDDMRRRESYYRILKGVFDKWMTTNRGKLGNLRGAGD